jgi:Flp pilus assembly protein TadG
MITPGFRFRLAQRRAQNARANKGRSKRAENGQAMVEFALTFAIFIMLFIGFIGLAIVFFAWLTTVSAAREGARYVIANPSASDSQIKSAICASSVMLGGNASNCNSLTTSDLIITTEPSSAANRIPNAQISVKVQYRAQVPTLGITWLDGSKMTFLGPIWVSSQAVMRIDP